MDSKMSGMEAIEGSPCVIPSEASDLAAEWLELGPARSLASLGMTDLPHRSLARRMPVRRRVSSGDEVLELSLDIGQQRARAQPEQVGPEPAIAQLLLHQRQPLERLPRRADPAGRL